MLAKDLKAKALKHCKPGGVVYATPDGCIFKNKVFAIKHGEKTGQQVKEFLKPKKRVKNGTK